MRRLAPLAAPLLVGCGAMPATPVDAGAPAFDPLAYFDGHSHGTGTIDLLGGHDRQLSVDSVGRRDGGGLVLVQRIVEGDKPARLRRWTMRRVAPGRYTGWLSDAQGPVDVLADGNQLSIRYRTRDGLAAEQRLALRRDGRTVDNAMTLSKLGIPLARVHETIVKR